MIGPRETEIRPGHSGSQTAGDKIWVATGTVNRGDPVHRRVYSARELPNGAPDRAQCYSALATFIEEHSEAAFGLDFPFGIPSEVTDCEDRETLVFEFSEVYDSPQDLRERCECAGSLLPGERVKCRRATDEDANAPLCPCDLRMMYQTYTV